MSILKEVVSRMKEKLHVFEHEDNCQLRKIMD